MPTPPNPPRPRGFAPLLRGVGHPDQHLRVSDAERQAVADRLAEHFGDGRLDQTEFDERVSQAMNAKTRGDLRGLFDDLPDPGQPGVVLPGIVLPGAGAPAGLSQRHLRQRGLGRRLVSFALLAVITAAAAESVVRVTVPWLWIGFLAVVLLVAQQRAGHSRSDQDHQ